MITENHPFPWLSFIDRPAFCVKGEIVIAVNAAAENYCITSGISIEQLVAEHYDAYKEFREGCLYLTVNLENHICQASVSKIEGCDLFILNRDEDDAQLRAVALAAQQLRLPLSNAMTVTNQLLSELKESDSAAQQAGYINHSLFQLLRIVSNMSDSNTNRALPFTGMQTANLTAVFAEVMEKAATYAHTIGVSVEYAGPDTPIFGLANPEKLERAVYNLLSNAIKFSSAGDTVEAKLTKNGNLLSFVVCNPTTPDDSEQNFWKRYTREPAIADSRHGLGLGMHYVSTVATSHGGTLLVDHPTPTKTRVTMTCKIKQDANAIVRSPAMLIGDYAGGLDKALLEFSDILPSSAYQK